MREGWELKKLGDIGKVSMCKRILKNQTLPSWDIPFYKIGTFGKTPDAFISKDLYLEYREKYSFPKKGQILLSASGTIGRRVIYDGEPAYFQDSNIVWIDNDDKIISNKFLYHFYGFCDWQPSKGATISRLYNDNLRRIPIPIPPLAEQKQIVAILDEAFAAIDRARANIEKDIENAKELFQSKLNDIFSQKGEGWEEKKLGDVCEILMGQSPKGDSYNTKGIGNPLINGPVEFGPKPFSKTIKSKWTTKPTKLCDEGDLILCVRGSTTGRINIAGFEGCIGRGVASIRYKKNQEWINFFVRCNQTSIYNLGTGSTFPNVSGKILSEIKFPEPSLDTQKQLINVMKRLESDVDSLIKNYERKVFALDELKKSILQKAFSGELTGGAKAVDDAYSRSHGLRGNGSTLLRPVEKGTNDKKPVQNY